MNFNLRKMTLSPLEQPLLGLKSKIALLLCFVYSDLLLCLVSFILRRLLLLHDSALACWSFKRGVRRACARHISIKLRVASHVVGDEVRLTEEVVCRAQAIFP